MPTNEKVKPLYMAKTIGELNQFTNVPIGTVSIKVKCNSAHKVFVEAEKARKDGDEERAYVLYMKYCSLLQNINKLAEYQANKKFYEDLLGKTALVQSVEWAEKLQTSLQRRYALLQEEKECIEKQEREEILKLQIPSGILDSSEQSNHFIRPSEKKNGSSLEVEQPLIIDNDVKTTLKGCITSQRLYDLISDDFYSLLIIDARSAASYKESHLIYQNCVNVPEEVIRPGLTGSALEKSLPSNTLLLWEKRSNVEYVILLDWISNLSTVVPGTKLHHLKDTLCKWDTRVTLKNEPLILEGGYEDWLLHYPTYTTCSWVQVPKTLRNNDVDDISLDFDYPTLDDVISNGSRETLSVLINHIGESTRPTVDRSMKPKKDNSGSDQHHFSGTSASDIPSIVSVASSSKAQTPSTYTHSSTMGILSEESCSIPQVNRYLKPSGSESSSDQDDLDKSVQQMEEIIAKEQLLVNENLNIEKERLKSEQQYESIRQQQENEPPENSKSDISKKEQILLERIQALEIEKKKKAKEEMALKLENEAIKKQYAEILQHQDSVYARFEKEKEQMRQKEKERRRLERETERLRQERKTREQEKKESPKRDLPQPSTVTAASIAADKAVEKESSPTKRAKPDSSTSSAQQRGDSSAGDSYFVKLKNDAASQSLSASRRPSLTRSHSSPNIAQMMAIEEDDKGPYSHPQVDRSVKPFTKTDRKMPMIGQLQPTEYSAARLRNLMPVYGNQGRALTGLRNLGNTCFMNSIIQCLAQTTSLATYFVSGTYRQHLNRQNPVGRRGEIAEEFAVIIRALWAGQYRSITPRDFKNTVSKFISMFECHEQQDSQEFLCFLMDGLHEDLNEVKEKPQVKPQNIENLRDVVAAEKAWEIHKQLNESLIVSLFQGQLKSTVRCLHCGKQSVKFDTFMYLSLPIPTGTNRSSLSECLALFLKEEKMTGGSRWKCPKCGEPREAEKKMDIWKLPPVLLIHLKRFSYEGMWRRKLQTYVDFPIQELDMRNYVLGPKRPSEYQLYAVSNHYGTMEGGHYTAFCRNSEYRRWYKFDDHEVSEMATSDVKSAAAYILFYTSMDMQVPQVKD